MNPLSSKGFSLIELLVAIAVLGILAALAMPAYHSYRLRANRVEARVTLVEAAQLAERWFVRNNTYAGVDDVNTGDPMFPATSPHGLYTLAYNAPAAAAFSITATATGSQLGDSDCATLSINHLGQRSSSNAQGIATQNCW